MYAPGRTFGSRRKAPGVEAWQTKVALIVRSSRPSGWAPQGQVRIVYDFHVNRDADCDNLMKALNDAIAAALGVDDRIFLPAARSKTKVATADERIVVTVSDA
jgi:Holliday junction resolvase RusA-like endonuclease